MRGNAVVPDGKVLQLGLRSPVTVGRHIDAAHAVELAAAAL
jgi:hypothetical protein